MRNNRITASKALYGFCHVAMVLALTACAGLNPLPGGALIGCERVTDSFAFAETATLMRLETRAEAPYSVWLRVTIIDDRLFIDAAPRRQWHEAIKRNPEVRIQIEASIYPARAVLTTEPRFNDPFLSGRLVYELRPKEKAPGLSALCSSL